MLDLTEQGYITLRDVKYFVLDEADRMLDMGFIHDIRKLIKMLPQKRQSLFFSATMPKNILELSKTILINPKNISVAPVSSTADTIQQHVYFTNQRSKKDLLFHILKDKEIIQILIFSKTKHGANKIVKNLQKKKNHLISIKHIFVPNFFESLLLFDFFLKKKVPSQSA